MAQRLHAQFTDDAGTLWTVRIHDANFTGTSAEFTLAAGGFTLTYHGTNNNTHQALIPSEVEFTMLERQTPEDDFLEDLADTADGEILLEVHHGTFGIWWTGIIAAEQVVRQDIAAPAPVTIVAQCGLGKLHQTKYRQSDGTPYDAPQLLPVILANAIDLPTKQFYGTGATDPFIIANAYLDNTELLSTSDALNGVRIDPDTWTKPNETGEDKYYTCAEILQSLATVYTARIFQSRGRWFFVPVASYRYNASNLPITAYKKTGSIAADTTYGTSINTERPTGATLKRLRGWSRTHIKPLKEVFRTQDFQGNVPLFYDHQTPAADFPLSLEDQDRVYSQGSRIRIQGTIQYQHPAGSSSAGSDQLKRFRVKIVVNCGTRYLSRLVSYSGEAYDFHSLQGTGASYTPHYLPSATWNQQDTHSYNLITSTFDGNASQNIELPFNFVTPPLPAEEDHLDVQIVCLLVDHTGAATGVNSAQGFLIRGDLDSGGGGGDTLRWRAVHDSTSTEVLDQGQCLLGGVVTAGSRGVLKVQTATGFEPSDEWVSVTNAIGNPINALGVEEVLRYRTTARAVQQGTLRGSEFHFYQCLLFASRVHVTQELTYRAQYLETDITAFVSSSDNASTVTTEAGGIKDTRPPAIVTTTAGNSSQADADRQIVAATAGNLADVQADVETNTTAIGIVQGDIATLQADGAANQSAIASNDTDIDDLQKTLKGDAGTDLGVFSDTADTTAAALVVQSTSAKIQGGDNTSVTATQTSPGTIALNVQAGATGSEAQVTALQVQGSSTVNTKATVSITGGDFRVNSPTQYASGATATFLDGVTFSGGTTGIDHQDLTNKPPRYHGILLDGAGTGDLVGTGSITFSAGDLLAHTGSGQEGVYQCTTATTINRAGSESAATANWVGQVTKFEQIAAPGDLSLADLDPSSGSDTFSDTLASFSVTTTAGLTLTGGAGIILIGTTTAIGNVTSTGTVTGSNLTTAGAVTGGSLTASGLTYPTSDGTSGQVLTTDGAGALTFQTAGGGGSGYSGPIPLAAISGRWQWSTGDDNERVMTGMSTYGPYNWYSHSTEPSHSTIRDVTGSEVVGTTNAQMPAYMLQSYGVRIPTSDKKVRVDFQFRMMNFGTGADLGFSLWGATAPANGTTGNVTYTLLGQSADVTTTGTSTIAFYSGTFTTPADITADFLLPMWEHRGGPTLTTNTYIFGQFNMYLTS